jgi:hypothetical protein
VELDRVLTYFEGTGDLFVRQSLGGQLKDLPLSFGQWIHDLLAFFRHRSRVLFQQLLE